MFGKWDKEWELTDELFSHLEEFICRSYGYKEKDANKVWWLKFRDRQSKRKLLTCLHFHHAKKPNYTVHEQIMLRKYGDCLYKAIISVVMIDSQRVRYNGFINHS